MEGRDFAGAFLQHYGVKGMKWGVHKKRVDREPPSEDARRVGNIHSRVGTQKTTKMLSNSELEDAIKRMNLEQQYSRLSGGRDKTKMQKAAKFVSELLITGGKQTVQQTATNEMKNQVQQVLKNK